MNTHVFMYVYIYIYIHIIASGRMGQTCRCAFAKSLQCGWKISFLRRAPQLVPRRPGHRWRLGEDDGTLTVKMQRELRVVAQPLLDAAVV